VVAVGGERFGVPMDAIVETARIAKGRIRQIRSGAAFVLRDRTIPFLRLSEILGLPDASGGQAQCNVLIARIGQELIGLEIDGVAERLDVLVRPMTGLLAAVPGALGSALLGDGRVLMVLNLQELANDHTDRGQRHRA